MHNQIWEYFSYLHLLGGNKLISYGFTFLWFKSSNHACNDLLSALCLQIQVHFIEHDTMSRAPTQGAPTPNWFMGNNAKELQLSDHNVNINYKSSYVVTSESCNHFIYLTLPVRYLLCYTSIVLLLLSSTASLSVKSTSSPLLSFCFAGSLLHCSSLQRYYTLSVHCLPSLQLPSLLLCWYGHYWLCSTTSWTLQPGSSSHSVSSQIFFVHLIDFLLTCKSNTLRSSTLTMSLACIFIAFFSGQKPIQILGGLGFLIILEANQIHKILLNLIS